MPNHRKGADFMEKCRFKASILMEKCRREYGGTYRCGYTPSADTPSSGTAS